MLTEIFLRYGQPEPPAELIPLRAGPLSLLYDPASGMVRRIKLGEIEVLRGIYTAVRDHNWDTVPGTIHETSRVVESASFRLEFDSEHRHGNIHFAWHGIVRGETDGTLRYEFDGEAKTAFLRNRIGFCVLHPIRECAGARAKQLRVDGAEIGCRFPELIEPQIFGQGSFRELRGVSHEVATDLWAELMFEGDTFEMEDQRNWTDASFKTYCTPLTLPFPVEIKPGNRIRQSVTLGLIGNPARPRATEIEGVSPTTDLLTLKIPEAPNGQLPALGLGVASHGRSLSEPEMLTLFELRPSHLRLDLRLAATAAASTLARAAREASQLGARLELALHLPREGGTDPGDLLRALEQQAAPPVRILALREGEAATSAATLAWIRKHFGPLGAPIGAGSDCNFCELNRERALGRLALTDADFLFWSINPQVHAFDHLSIMETLEAQAATVHSARGFAGNRPLVVSPVTLRQRFNPVATSAPEPAPADDLPPQADPRQLSHFAAAWTIGSIAALASAGLDSVTLYETTGWRGVMEEASGSPLPGKFPSAPGSLFPVFHALSHLAGFRQMAVVPASGPEGLCAMVLFKDRRLNRIVVANHSPAARTVRLVAPTASGTSLRLDPYEVAHVDLS